MFPGARVIDSRYGILFAIARQVIRAGDYILQDIGLVLYMATARVATTIHGKPAESVI